MAIPVFHDRVAPLADGARVFAVWNCRGPRLTPQGVLAIPLAEPGPAARQAAVNGIDLLVCRAISRLHGEALEQAGIQVHSGLSGPVEAMIEAVVRHPGPPPDLALPCWHRWQTRAAADNPADQGASPPKHRPSPGLASNEPP